MKLPSKLSRLLLRIKGLIEYKDCSFLKNRIDNSELDVISKYNLRNLAQYGKRYSNYIDAYINEELLIYKEMEIDEKLPIVICIVKDDLRRTELFLEHYRNIGIRQFVFLDDNSSDGTLELLRKQKDTFIFKSYNSYSTIQRQVWINKIIRFFGINRWYIVVDSDELLDFDYDDINDFIDYLKKNNRSRAKALLLDMVSDKGLYIDKQEDIINTYNYFLPTYRYENVIYDQIIKGGIRDELFFKESKVGSPVVSKYPVIYVNEKDVLINSHYNFPFNRNIKVKPDCILKHYKFLSNDSDEYIKRAKQGNFGQNSLQYKTYIEKKDKVDFDSVKDRLVRYDDFNSVNLDDIKR